MIRPVYRSKNFSAQFKENTSEPLDGFLRVEDIVDEIVNEGEGATDFMEHASKLVDTIDDDAAAEKFVREVQAEKLTDGKGSAKGACPFSGDAPAVLEADISAAQNMRKSHLYRFTTAMSRLQREQRIDPDFTAARLPTKAGDAGASASGLAINFVRHFNAVYLVLVVWLSRMYEVPNAADRDRRRAIESVASWPLMSMAMRPMLELAGMLPGVDAAKMFAFAVEDLPSLPYAAPQLALAYLSTDRSHTMLLRMDGWALAVLTSVAD